MKKKVEARAFCTKDEQPTILFIFFSMASKLRTNGFFGDRSIVFWSSYWMWDDDPFFFLLCSCCVCVCVLCSVLFCFFFGALILFLTNICRLYIIHFYVPCWVEQTNEFQKLYWKKNKRISLIITFICLDIFLLFLSF